MDDNIARMLGAEPVDDDCEGGKLLDVSFQDKLSEVDNEIAPMDSDEEGVQHVVVKELDYRFMKV